MIPLAFHVDYWNYIGWTDPYSQARFSDRQRQHSRRRGASFVVTPQRELVGPLALDNKGNLSHAQSFELDRSWKFPDLYLAVFVQHPQSGDVLQALSASCH